MGTVTKILVDGCVTSNIEDTVRGDRFVHRLETTAMVTDYSETSSEKHTCNRQGSTPSPSPGHGRSANACLWRTFPTRGRDTNHTIHCHTEIRHMFAEPGDSSVQAKFHIAHVVDRFSGSLPTGCSRLCAGTTHPPR